MKGSVHKLTDTGEGCKHLNMPLGVDYITAAPHNRLLSLPHKYCDKSRQRRGKNYSPNKSTRATHNERSNRKTEALTLVTKVRPFKIVPADWPEKKTNKQKDSFPVFFHFEKTIKKFKTVRPNYCFFT